MPAMDRKAGSSSAKKFHCSQCSRSYTKLEHLLRHQRTHSNSKPFQCNQCGRSFGRKDVLGRHERLHASQPQQANSSPETTRPVTSHETLSEMPGSSSLEAPGLLDIPSFEQPDLSINHDMMECDNLLEWLMPDFLGSSDIPLPSIDYFHHLNPRAPPESGFPTTDDLQGHSPHEPGKTAVQQSYRLIDDLTKRFHTELHQSGITTEFLDFCLTEFFGRISPCFPVIHEPTFTPKETLPPLLLNMVALGSLFVCHPGSLEKGETLWRLGHIAVATSWQTLIGLRGPRDSCDGVQLVLTALLGQTYALLSRNEDIRTTALVWHGLGFYWARVSGMYAVEDLQQDEIPCAESCEPEKNAAWRRWAAIEVQRRSILGHYIIDGLISQTSGSPASARHLINSLVASCSDGAFSAKTADDWIVEMKKSTSSRKPFNEIFVSIFSSDYSANPLSLPRFSISVVLEGIQSLIADLRETSGPVVGSISKQQIIKALINLYENNLSGQKSADDIALLLRWHTICLELSTPSVLLYRELCQAYGIPESLTDQATKANHGNEPLHLSQWASSTNATRGILHAIAISKLLHHISLKQAHAPHIPASIFASGMTIGGYCLANGKVAILPRDLVWRDVWHAVLSGNVSLPPESTESSNLQQTLGKSSHPVHLPQELNSLLIGLRTIASRWSISSHLDRVIQHLSELARNSPSV
ncbi:hypothetical protein P170DRAFT_396402 [Aspergillus steynii IBT 23096]|uniref:C2H2-type domain-containing protein n=1 Tax=Aspergillus steynii IBT 23096 TaxID=1392250 RepID=A0A2I2GLK3_9EURO|nr:uncharacterized protein P170DRAFT_396402 [Aspergillus steynii IBT 23096]PLB53756.1 hypothetical protein P170DRAFT_396402 [Aspergillus steynii IBT 23096]